MVADLNYKDGESNICDLIDSMLEQDFEYSDVGRVFARGLQYQKKKDTLGYSKMPVHDRKPRQSAIMKNAKNYLLYQLHTKSFYEQVDFSPRIKYDDSIIGKIKFIVEEKGERAFDDIGKAIHEGSKKYVKDNPEARNTNYKQFREYRSIMQQLDEV